MRPNGPLSVVDKEVEARRLANAILDDVALYGGAGGPSGAAIEEGRALFRSKVAPELHPVFDAVLAERSRIASSGPAPASGRRPVGMAIGLVLLAGAGISIWALTRTGGTEVGRAPIPGDLALDLGASDTLTFTADTDVTFLAVTNDAKPVGCLLDVSLLRDGADVARSSCDLFATSALVSVSASSHLNRQANGTAHLRIDGQRIACRLTSPSAGRWTIHATSNLSTCVPASAAATLHVFRAPGDP